MIKSQYRIVQYDQAGAYFVYVRRWWFPRWLWVGHELNRQTAADKAANHEKTGVFALHVERIK